MTASIIVSVLLACFVGFALLARQVRLHGSPPVLYSSFSQVVGNPADWQLRHFAITPFGIIVTTLAVTHLADPASRPVHQHLGDAADLIDVSAVMYGTLAVIVELGGRIMFWAFAQYKKDMEAWRAERKAEATEASLAELEQRIALNPDTDVRTLIADQRAGRPLVHLVIARR